MVCNSHKLMDGMFEAFLKGESCRNCLGLQGVFLSLNLSDVNLQVWSRLDGRHIVRCWTGMSGGCSGNPRPTKVLINFYFIFYFPFSTLILNFKNVFPVSTDVIQIKS